MHNVDCYGSEAKLTACPRNTETSGQNASMDCGTSGKNITGQCVEIYYVQLLGK